MVKPSFMELMVVGVVLYATPKSLNGIRKQGHMIDDRYIVTEHENGISITMKVYAEWVAENGKPQVFHKTDTVGFKSPLVEKFDA